MDQKMGSFKLESKVKSFGKNYVRNRVRGQKGFRCYEYDDLKNETEGYAYEGKWAKECHRNVSVHAFHARYKKFFTYTGSQTDITLVYVIKDGNL